MSKARFTDSPPMINRTEMEKKAAAVGAKDVDEFIAGWMVAMKSGEKKTVDPSESDSFKKGFKAAKA